MLLGGDESGRTQHGNNNAWCQDNELSWLDWENVDGELLEFTRKLIKLPAGAPGVPPDAGSSTARASSCRTSGGCAPTGAG